MTDLSDTIAPKSDQMNADDLIGGPRTITVSGVKRMDAPDQPIAIHFDGDDNKPFKPCKSMRRVLVMVWGNDGNGYVGRSMTLYRDPGVQFGGQQVGGIRISHMSHIDKPVTMALTATRANRKPFTVKPLAAQKAPAATVSFAGEAAVALDAAIKDPKRWLEVLRAQTVACPTLDDLAAIRGIAGVKTAEANAPDRIKQEIAGMFDDAGGRLAPVASDAPDEDDGWPGPSASQVAA